MGLEAYQHGAGRLWKARNPIRTRRGFHAEVPSPVVRPWLPCQQTGVGKAAGIDVVVHGGNTLVRREAQRHAALACGKGGRTLRRNQFV